jgi:hypothetical protein
MVGAFGIAPRASNTSPYSLVLMYSPQLCKNTHFFHGSLCNITFHHRLEESSKYKTYCTWWENKWFIAIHQHMLKVGH